MAWTDERLDDLAQRMDDGFARVDLQARDLREEMHLGFERVDKDIRELRGDVRQLRVEMVGLNEATRTELSGAIAGLAAKMDRLTYGALTILVAGFAGLFVRGF
jgi:hypothetical protein